MRRRLDLAMTLVGDPRIIFLDEPTTGLDPRSRRTMWQIIRDLAAGGVTIFLTTQYLEEADELADRIAVLDQGRIVAEGTADELKRRVPGGHIRLQFADAARPRIGRPLLAVGVPRRRGAHPAGPGRRRRPALRALLDQLDSASIEVEGLSIHTPDLDDVFFALTGQPDDSARPDSQKVTQSMSTMSYAVADSATMLRRSLRHMIRYPSMTLLLAFMPVVFLLIFVYVFGGTLGAGLGHVPGGGGAPPTSATSCPASSSCRSPASRRPPRSRWPWT